MAEDKCFVPSFLARPARIFRCLGGFDAVDYPRYRWSSLEGMKYAMGSVYSERYGRYVVTILFDMFVVCVCLTADVAPWRACSAAQTNHS